MAAQLGSNLQGVAYVLDEPTIGLHARDNRILLDTLEKLQAKGNTLVVVEHDGTPSSARTHHRPRAGRGRARRRDCCRGTAAELKANPKSITGKFLSADQHPLHARSSPSWGGARGATKAGANALEKRPLLPNPPHQGPA